MAKKLAPNSAYNLLNPPAPKPSFGTISTADEVNQTAHNAGLTPTQFAEATSFGTAPAPDAGSLGTNGGETVDPTMLANDWYKAFFGNYGVPSDVQGSLIDILKKYAADPGTAQVLATQYLRTTPWYQTTFPGFNAGVSNGLFTDETGYRSYLDAVNNVYNQYMGRHVSGDEVSALLNEGANPSLLANRFQGQAWVNANSPEVQYLGGAFGQGRLNTDQLTALGNENAGIDTAQGQLQQKIMAKAEQIRQKLFTGSLATPGLSLGANGLSAPSLGGTRQTPDIQA